MGVIFGKPEDHWTNAQCVTNTSQRITQTFSRYHIFAGDQINMDSWELDFEYLRIQHMVKDAMNREKLPDLQAILFLIGIQETGVFSTKYTKEEKQDLMHVAVCELLSSEGYFEFVGRDQDGWPHYNQVQNLEAGDLKAQETLLKSKVVQYFKTHESTYGSPAQN